MSAILSDSPETITPTEDEAILAQESSRQLARVAVVAPKKPVRVKIESDEKTEEIVIVPASAFRLFKDILAQMARGNAITLIPVHAELTTNQAADLLNVSRPFLIEQLEKNLIPYRKVGSHRRILFKDLMAYKESIDRKRLEALDELSALDQELGFDR